MHWIASYSFSPQWAFNRWLVALLVLLAGALVVYLYRAQQKVASKPVIITLTTIRLLLVLLMFVLLAGLSVRWSRTASSGGTLWLLVDSSASMGQSDPRATPVEKLRWADALGFLPSEFRAMKLDRHAARLEALRADLAYLRSRGELPSTNGDANARAEFAAAVREWGDRLRAAAGERAALIELADRATRSAEKGPVPWAELQSTLDARVGEARRAADAADERLLAERGSDAKLKEALEKVGEMSRAQLAQLALAEKGKENSAVSLIDLVPRQATKVLTFADGVQPVAVDNAAALPAALKTAAAAAPSGQSTNLAAALRYVQDHLRQDEPASVVLLSDGRHNNGGDLVEPARLLGSRGVRVFTLALGSRQVVADASVEQVDAPDWVYHDDTVRASALLRLDGLSDKPVTVDFYRGNTKVESKTVTPSGDHATQVVHFSDKPPEAGVFDYDVRVAEIPDEAVKENNRLGARVAVRKDKLGVLVVEDMPRWEYRHLVNYLSRDQRVKLQTVLLQPARVEGVTPPAPVRASPTNEGVEAQLLPQRAQDWAAFDWVVLGDVPKEALNEEDMRGLVSAVRDRGTTLLLIAGQFNMPQRFAGTPLEGLVPVELSGEWSPEALARHLKNGFRPAVTPEGQGSMLSQFTIDEGENRALWGAMPAWYWHSALTTAKRSASVIWTISDGPVNGSGNASPSQPHAEASASERDASRDRALLCTMSVGMGRVMCLTSDSTWRMRQVKGGNPHERFWGQVVRWVVDHELPAGGKRVRFGTDKGRYVAGESVVVTARILGDDFSPMGGQKIRVVAKVGGASGEGKVVAQADMTELPDAVGYYRATLGGVPAGRVELALAGGEAERLMATDVTATQKTLAIDVQSQLSVEQRNVNADRATLSRIAEAAGGACLDGPYADVLAAGVPRLNYPTERVEQVGLFTAPDERYASLSHWIFLAAFVVLASAEWIVRKGAGLV